MPQDWLTKMNITCVGTYIYLDLDNKLIRLFGRVTVCLKLKKKIKLLYILASILIFNCNFNVCHYSLRY